MFTYLTQSNQLRLPLVPGGTGHSLIEPLEAITAAPKLPHAPLVVHFSRRIKHIRPRQARSAHCHRCCASDQVHSWQCHRVQVLKRRRICRRADCFVAKRRVRESRHDSSARGPNGGRKLSFARRPLLPELSCPPAIEGTSRRKYLARALRRCRVIENFDAQSTLEAVRRRAEGAF